MDNAILSIMTAILSLEFIIGNVGNGFIALVNCIDWIKRRNISTVDRILTALSFTRIGLIWFVFLSRVASGHYIALILTGEMSKMINIIWTVVHHFSIWLATNLSIFYFLKIANFTNSTFLYLKWRVSKVLLVTLLVSLIILLLNISLINMHIDVWVDGHDRNMTCSSSLKECAHFLRRLLFTNIMFTFIPFTISLIIFLLLIFSLWRHLRKLQLNVTGSRDTSTTAHLQSLLIVIVFLLLSAIFFLSLVMQVLFSELMEKNLTTMICQIFGMAYPVGHSCILIVGNRKLRQALLSVLWWLKFRFKDAEFLTP
ncbi:taste receptor type 2 member 14-like [Oryctolagus cuniculus]|uniref:taste receptor type 2 member 14-like n=1 Tax=Oryctolagus cuniculus TaxID=9986 RepID=UPI00387A7663